MKTNKVGREKIPLRNCVPASIRKRPSAGFWHYGSVVNGTQIEESHA
jgi:hypothetical protein